MRHLRAKPDPAAFAIGIIGGAKAFRRGDGAVHSDCPCFIAHGIQRREYIRRQPAGFAEDCIHDIGGRCFELRQSRQTVDIGNGFQHEFLFGNGRLKRHDVPCNYALASL